MARLRGARGPSQAGGPIAADSQLMLIDRSAKRVRRPRSGAGGVANTENTRAGRPAAAGRSRSAALRCCSSQASLAASWLPACRQPSAQRHGHHWRRRGGRSGCPSP
jgi:hypothetical protein